MLESIDTLNSVLSQSRPDLMNPKVVEFDFVACSLLD